MLPLLATAVASILDRGEPHESGGNGMKALVVVLGIGCGTSVAAHHWGTFAAVVLGVAGLLVVVIWVAVLDRYRVASQDVLGIEPRD